ncbi:hypothetical protein Leryth_015135 [Lithospermum erythrorhizon]|nr:hypothetical protein Leryth_015135 [Lithospermum erythrorhizon]
MSLSVIKWTLVSPLLTAGPSQQIKGLSKSSQKIKIMVVHENQKIVSLKEEAHLNTCFKHFILFTSEFGLIEKKELAPLQELIESIVPYST